MAEHSKKEELKDALDSAIDSAKAEVREKRREERREEERRERQHTPIVGTRKGEEAETERNEPAAGNSSCSAVVVVAAVAETTFHLAGFFSLSLLPARDRLFQTRWSVECNNSEIPV